MDVGARAKGRGCGSVLAWQEIRLLCGGHECVRFILAIGDSSGSCHSTMEEKSGAN